MLCVNPADLIPIPTMLLSYDCGIKFDIYLRQGNNFCLLARNGALSEARKRRLQAHGVDELYIHSEHMEAYDDYVEFNFSGLLQDETIPLHDRSKILYEYSLGLGKELVRCGKKTLPCNKQRIKLEHFAESAFEFVSRNSGATWCVARLLSHDYRTFSHCVNVSLYSLILMVALDYGKHRAKLIGMGAALHDLGKVKIPREILDKPGPLTPEERLVINRHPMHGLEFCRDMDLDRLSLECIVHHHEKLDGSGYPSQTRHIPEHVRIVTLSDIYDALTSARPYSRALEPFEALKIMQKDVEAGRLDKDIYKLFVNILSEGSFLPE